MRIVNCHLPKTATITTQKMFGIECVIYGHKTLNGAIPKRDDVVSFTIIRDPLERFCSAIKMFVKKNPNLPQSKIIDIALNKEFTNDELVNGRNSGQLHFSIVLHTLSMFHPHINAFNEDKTPKADNLIDFRNFVSELEELTGRQFNHIPHENKGASVDIELSAEHLEAFNIKYRDDVLFYEKFLEQRSLVSSF